jgi:hypothetical protein
MPGTASANPYSLIVEDAGALDLLEHLQDHQSEDISCKATEILSSYFEAASDDNGAVVPDLGQQGMYAFPAAARDMSQAEGTFDFKVV